MTEYQQKTAQIQRISEILPELPREDLYQLRQELEEKIANDQRHHHRVPFFIEAKRKYQEQSLSEFIRDIGAGGMFLETSAQFEIGSELTLVIHPVGLQNEVALKGQVVRKESSGVGIRFPEPVELLQEIAEPAIGRVQYIQLHLLGFFKARLKEILPQDVLYKYKSGKSVLHKTFIPFLKIRYYGQSHYCPVCQSRISKFLPFLDPPIPNAYCPICRSMERHRLDWLFFNQKTDLFDGKSKKMLHIAPEEIFEKKFIKIANLEYVTADLNNPKAMHQFSVTDIPFQENSFDIVYCSHVLEHVPEDEKAMRELHRVLKTDGWALLQVPITANKTYEDPAITSPAERKKWFGQEDHVRRYGSDFKDRLEEAGFNVTVIPAKDMTNDEGDFERMGFQRNRLIFFCRK